MTAVHGSAAATWAGWDTSVIDVAPQTRGGVVSGSWGGWDGDISIGDDVGVSVYDVTGTAFQSAVGSAKPQYRIELSKGGTASLQLLLDDAATSHMTDRSLVKTTVRGVTDGFRVNGEMATLSVDGGNKWLTFDQMPSLIGCLHDGPVYPDGGLPASGVIDKDAPTTRAFGPMSPRGPWYVPSDWVHPEGVLIPAQTIRTGYPKELANTGDVYWIAPSPGPQATQAAGTVVHYRREFNVSAATPVEFLFTADNYLSLWLNGQEIIPADYSTPYVWKQVYSWQGVLPKGKQVIYARVENAARTVGANPLGLVGAVFQLDSNGNHSGVITRTHPDFWLATTNDVGWYAGQILHQVMTESQAAADAGPSLLRMTFDTAQDTAGVAWSGTRLTKLFNVMTDMVDDVIAMLSQDGVDVVADARALTLNAYNRLGTDKYSTVEFKLGEDGGNLLEFDTQTTGTRATVAVAQLADGRWHTVQDAAGVAAIGRVVLPVQLGTTTSPEAAEVTMRQMLAETAQPVTALTAKTSTLTGPQLFRNVLFGDSVKFPDKRGSGTLKQRFYAYNVDRTADLLQLWGEFVKDPT